MLQVVIVDDEPKAIDLLKGYCDKTQGITCINTFRNPIKALDFIKTSLPRIVLLDINMPKLSGIDLAKLLPKECSLVFTTAHSEHAVESYELQAVDYLLKPISYKRFAAAIQKVKAISNDGFLIVKSGYDTYKIFLKDLLYLKKEGNYMAYVTRRKKVLARQTISEALSELSNDFKQVHKSFIIPFSKVSHLQGGFISIEEFEIPIGTTYRKEVETLFNT
jgi:DNA-binding LytR/AlgR family response regulator